MSNILVRSISGGILVAAIILACIFNYAGWLFLLFVVLAANEWINITIGKNVGIGPSVKIITSYHSEEGKKKPVLHSKLIFKEVIIDDDADLGTGCIILPGVKVGQGAIVGAGAVVTSDVMPYHVVAGVPAKTLYIRK